MTSLIAAPSGALSVGQLFLVLMMENLDTDVVVLGAGVAGLAAARGLAEAGRSVILVESAERVGGRLRTVRMVGSDLPVEVGAEFVHGRPPELMALIEEAEMTILERNGEFYSFEGGRVRDSDWEGSAFDILNKLPEDEDQSFAEYLAQQNVSEKTTVRARSYVEGFNAADANVIGTAALKKQQEAANAIEGDRIFRIREGYDRLPIFLLDRVLQAGGRLYLKTTATAVDWKRGEVRVRTGNSGLPVVNAKRVVIALPLGVLQAGSLAISPMPRGSADAIAKLATGSASRITLVFRERFWEEKAQNLSFLFASSEPVPVWWSSAPDISPVITGWLGGPRAANGPAGDELRDAALASLGAIFWRDDLDSLLLSWHTHDWQRDPLALGAYSYAPVGALRASNVLTEPVEDTLYFAGEHTDTTGHWGTVHGALRSGLRVVQQIGR